MQLIGIISFPKRETFSMGYFIEKQEWCDKMSHLQIASPNGHLCHIRRPLRDLIGGQLGTH